MGFSSNLFLNISVDRYIDRPLKSKAQALHVSFQERQRQLLRKPPALYASKVDESFTK